MKHTPGPWRVVHRKEGGADLFDVYTDGRDPEVFIVEGLEATHHDVVIVAGVEPTHQPRTALANARLMAASPHMHEALTAAENALAIAASYRDITRGTDGDRINAALTTARRALAKARGEP